MDADTIATLTKNLIIIIGAVGAIVAAFQAQRAVTKVQEVHLSVNSRMDQLLASTDATARAQEQTKAAATASELLATQTATKEPVT